MPSVKNVLWVPSSCSSSPFLSPVKRELSGGDDSGKNRGGSGPIRRALTRQRKLRHVSDEEIGLGPGTSRSLPASPCSGGSQSPANSPHWSTWAVPQPLPLPLPKEGLRRGKEDGKEGSGERNPIDSATRSYSGHQTIGESTHHTARNSSLSPTYRRRGDAASKLSLSPNYRRRVISQYLNIESVHTNLRCNIHPRSAPTSGFSSPPLSPERFRSADLFHSSAVPPQKFQGFLDLKVSGLDRLASSSSHMPPRKTTHSTEHSPLNSPTSQNPCCNARSTIGVVLHPHHKSLPVNSSALLEGSNSNNANIHPLPLPPGVSKPSLSISIHPHFIEKPNGLLIKSQWQKGELIGRGTYGSVYLATNRETGASCAMKEVDLIPDDPKSAECIKQLEQEIKVLRNLEHPNIVQYYGCEIVEDRFCIYLEYIYPGSINKYVRKHCGSVTESVVRNFTRHILSGLAYLHSKETIHRDIKGANLLVNASGVVKLADFGLAKHLNGLVTDLSLKGSPHWMAPEVLLAAMRKDSSSELAFAIDIWSLGCTVIEMLNGKPPWSELNGVQAMFSVLKKSPAIPENLSSEGKDFLRLCFQRNPKDRPSAAMLLGHSFVRTSREQNVSTFLKDFSGM